MNSNNRLFNEPTQQIKVSIEMNEDQTEVCVIMSCDEKMSSDDMFRALETLVMSHNSSKLERCGIN